jgi:hypothetical protein
MNEASPTGFEFQSPTERKIKNGHEDCVWIGEGTPSQTRLVEGRYCVAGIRAPCFLVLIVLGLFLRFTGEAVCTSGE